MRSALRVTGFLLLSLPAVAWAASGTVVKSNGPVTVERGSQELQAGVGFALQPGDLLKTGRLGQAQIRFEDDSLFALVGGSAFRVERFQTRRKGSDEPGSAIFSLLRGGFRTVTGLIGKAKGDTYEVRTTVATIGVRGTTYSVVHCHGACAARGKFQAGLYVKTENGEVLLFNTTGRIQIRAGQVGYVSAQTAMPVKVKASPFDSPEFAAEFGFDLDFDVDSDLVPPDQVPSPS